MPGPPRGGGYFSERRDQAETGERATHGPQRRHDMKVAFTGKGGVGKTTTAAMLCRLYELDEQPILAVDADPDANLADTLGFPLENAPEPISGLKDLIHERTESKPGAFGGMFKLNPRVDDIPDKYCVKRGSLRLINMGTMDTAGKGCMCPESAFLKALMSHLMFREQDKLVMDMEAGIEHLGRGTATVVDAMIIVVQPDHKGVDTARRIVKLWNQLGSDKKVCYVGNAARDERDAQFLRDNLTDYPVLAVLPYSENVRVAGRERKPPFVGADDLLEPVRKFRENLEAFISGS